MNKKSLIGKESEARVLQPISTTQKKGLERALEHEASVSQVKSKQRGTMRKDNILDKGVWIVYFFMFVIPFLFVYFCITSSDFLGAIKLVLERNVMGLIMMVGTVYGIKISK